MENSVISSVNNIDDIDTEDTRDIDEDTYDLDIVSFYNINYELKYKNIDIKNISPDDFDSLDSYDQTYREDLVLLFKLGIQLALSQDLNKILDTCSKCIYSLYKKWSEHEQIIEILNKLKDTILLPFEITDDALFVYLFSCDYLEFFHECIKDLYYNNIISADNLDNLINKINEN
tara:strand:- start:7625 stop:8149 length:525 start_codon:yes stop_codon:yes gene_type:complete